MQDLYLKINDKNFISNLLEIIDILEKINAVKTFAFYTGFLDFIGSKTSHLFQIVDLLLLVCNMDVDLQTLSCVN